MREDTSQILKIVAENLENFILLLAKLERNEKQSSNPILNQIAKYYHIDSKLLQIKKLKNQIVLKVINENIDNSILKVTEEKVKYLITVQYGK